MQRRMTVLLPMRLGFEPNSINAIGFERATTERGIRSLLRFEALFGDQEEPPGGQDSSFPAPTGKIAMSAS
jgi:hypothetical protein